MFLDNPWTGKYISRPFLDGSDTVFRFLENKKILSDEWRFCSDKVLYEFNSKGYRCKEYEDIDKDNFVLVLGCSNTVGFGLNQEDTFAYKIAQELNTDLMNLAIGGASNDFIVKQLTRVLAQHKPKQVIINWTGIRRMSYWNNGSLELFSPSEIHNNIWTKAYKIHLDNMQCKSYFEDARITAQTLCKLADVPLFEFSNFEDYGHTDLLFIDGGLTKEIQVENIDEINEHYARDVCIRKGKTVYGHPGIRTNNEIVKRWREYDSMGR